MVSESDRTQNQECHFRGILKISVIHLDYSSANLQLPSFGGGLDKIE